MVRVSSQRRVRSECLPPSEKHQLHQGNSKNTVRQASGVRYIPVKNELNMVPLSSSLFSPCSSSSCKIAAACWAIYAPAGSIEARFSGGCLICQWSRSNRYLRMMRRYSAFTPGAAIVSIFRLTSFRWRYIFLLVHLFPPLVSPLQSKARRMSLLGSSKAHEHL